MSCVAKKRIGPAPTDSDKARAEALSVLTWAAREAGEALRRAGDADMARAVEEIITTVAGAAWCRDLDALTAKGGPQKWARNAPGRKLSLQPVHVSPAEGAREFVAELEAQLVGLRGSQNFVEKLAVHASNWLSLRGVPAGFVSYATDANHTTAMIEEMSKLAGRKKPDAKAYAVAALIGWGLSREEARNRLKNADI